MKTLLTAIVVCFGTILPSLPVQSFAAGAESSASFAKPGGLSKSKFSFKIGTAIFSKAVLFGETKRIKTPPPGVPKFRKKQKVTFKIGKKGQLTGPGFSMELTSESVTSNTYKGDFDASNPSQPDQAIVYKNSKGKPIGVFLAFYKFDFKSRTTYTVNYSLGNSGK